MSARKNNKNPPVRDLAAEEEWMQPETCIGCIWGRFEGTRQFCSLPRCVLEGYSLRKVMP
ncbi:hypothetical protein V3851_03770 [Paenibacillus sp. M1]|uniref:Uncharacterized protein n=1 Tax=Paenibacillus haidiansis TaxID=1574488 RepID=A0ABU7VNQ1_9BACL